MMNGLSVFNHLVHPQNGAAVGLIYKSVGGANVVVVVVVGAAKNRKKNVKKKKKNFKEILYK